MSYLGIDLETFSAADLKAVGAHRYAEDPSFEVLLFGFAFDDDDPTVIDLTAHEPIPKDVLDALRLNGIIKSGWNIAFERACLARHLGFDQPAGQWEDTMVLASVCGLPMGLGDCGAALHMSADKAKDKDGKALIRWFCKPCKPTKTRPDRTRHLPEDYPEKWSRFVAYNGQDVVAERAIRKTLAQWAPTGAERKIWAVDQQINDRGIRVDLTLANAAREMDRAYKAELTQQAIALTGMENPNSVEQVKQWLGEQEDIEVPSLNKKVVADVVAALSTDTAKQFMAIRSELARSSTKKFDAMVLSACADDHVRGCFQFCGAGRTGRWCLTGDHEVLTPNGWVRLDDWTGGDIICWNRASEQLSFQKSSALCFPYEGPMVKITGQRCAQISTPDHKMAVADYKGTWADKMAGELVGQSFRLPFTGYRQKPVVGPSASNAELRVLIMTQADGHYTADGCLRFHFKKERKIKRCRVLLRRVELPYTEHENGDRTTTITVLSRHLPIWLRQFRSKTYGPWLLNEDPVTFFDELEHWDAYRCGPNSIQYTTTTKQNADLVQALAVTSGLSATLVEKPRDNERWSTAYAVNIWLNPGRVSRITGRQTETTGFSGVVYCAETPTGYFMVRREGKVWITGNSGRRVQLQNLAKNKMPDLAACRALVRSGDLDGVKLLYGDVASSLSELVRTALIPEPGHTFIVCDYSAIEARVLAWIAGEEWALEEFRGKGQIYEATGAMMFHVPKETIAKGGCNHHRRQAAKTAVLACGYGGGKNALLAFGADKMGMSEEDMIETVDLWRKANPNAVRLWKDLERAAIRCVVHGTTQVSRTGGIRFDFERGILWMTLPSGRRIAYFGAQYGESRWKNGRTLSYMGIEQKTHKWARLETWGGKLTENCWAAGTPVLTSRGWVPIEQVDTTDLLWDGYTWVKHNGVFNPGAKDTIELDGLSVTPDHLIYTTEGWTRAEKCEGLYRAQVQLPDGDPQERTYGPARQTSVGGQMPVREHEADRHPGPHEEGKGRTPGFLRLPKEETYLRGENQTRDEQTPGVCGVALHDSPMHEPETQSLEELWGPRYYGMPCLDGDLRAILEGHGANLQTWAGAGPEGQRQRLLPGELPLGNAESQFPKQEGSQGRGIEWPENLSVGPVGSDRHPVHDSDLPDRPRLSARVPSDEARRKKQVFDLLNAGPRHQYVVLGNNGPMIVHNCVQATARDCLRDAMIHLTDADFDIRAHIHDEVVITEPLGGRTVEDVAAIMGQDLPWAPGLPLRGDGYTCDFYMKDG